MTANKRKNSQLKQVDVAILGAGPAGLQTALVLSRTRKKVIVFDDPEPPRNIASHGVHNFLGLDGLLPADIRKIAWEQIDKYDSAEFRKEKIVNVSKEEGEVKGKGEDYDSTFIITSDNQSSAIKTNKVVLAVGYHDVYPDIHGFAECWGDTIISCPFCDGYENRDRIWGVVADSKIQLEWFPKIIQNWTSKIKVFMSPDMEIVPSYQEELSKLGISVYRGVITKVNHSNTKVQSVILESGEEIEAETLLWIPCKRPSPLIQRLVDNLGLELDEQGNVKTDQMKKTNVKGLYATGDVAGSMGALAAAHDGGIAGVSIVHEWYH